MKTLAGTATKREVQGVQLYYKSTCVSSMRKSLHARKADMVAAGVATHHDYMDVMPKLQKENRNCLVQVRLTRDEMDRVRTLMDDGGYPTVSCFLRDIITRKRLPERRSAAVIDDSVLRERLNRLVYEVNKIGVNYNQVVSTYQRQAKQTRPDGSPYLNTRLLDEKVTALMRSTEGLRDEFAVILDIVKRYIQP